MRTLLSLVFLVAVLWASCTVKLGAFTLSEHVDRIGETPQAKDLLDGTRGRISPMLEDMKQRIFGEYVEAPTRATTTKEPPGERRKSLPRPSHAAMRTAPPVEPSGERRKSLPRPSPAAMRTAPPAEPPGERRKSLPRPSPAAPPAEPATERMTTPRRGPSSADDARLPGARRAAMRRDGA
ncbi:hypothetical protein [Nannocystis bainbridge]|uniref:Uncharacterized protein n=1 Tax=Nannocystis bainbridge TaxID=2995303 RepID=A0ABT5E0Q2_9BACT|nr:hypothetical protein [Nannocystis bainbridge]MDC0718548.1 hypothetical protein [Nannocystis bainbridge]